MISKDLSHRLYCFAFRLPQSQGPTHLENLENLENEKVNFQAWKCHGKNEKQEIVLEKS